MLGLFGAAYIVVWLLFGRLRTASAPPVSPSPADSSRLPGSP
jgi:hypothetical protein